MAAGAQLAAIALQRGVSRDDFLEAFAETDHAVGDFLVSEVLARLPSEIVEFLLETSVFDVFDADLCAVVTGVEEAAVLLERLVAANLFLVPVDERARWYHYHHLFGAFPRARLGSLGRSRLLGGARSGGPCARVGERHATTGVRRRTGMRRRMLVFRRRGDRRRSLRRQ